MANFNLQSLVPQVFINRIILESKALGIKESNPHIDEEREANVYVDANGKLVREEARFDLLKKSTNSDTLTVKIDFIMKETLGNDAISSWFDFENNKELLKYFKVKIIQSSDKELTSALLQAQSLLDIEKKIRRVVTREVLVGKELSNKSTNDFFSIVKENNIREYDIPFSETFVLKNSNPEHLAFFSVCFLDIKELTKDYGLDSSSEELYIIQGKVNAELIIKDYELVSETFLFVNQDNLIWTGPVTKLIENREIKNGEQILSVENVEKWVAGDGKSENPMYLDVKMIPNTKIQDFRYVNKMKKELLDFSILDNDLLNQINGGVKMPSSNNIVADINKNKAYFSELYITGDRDGAARFLFGIDMLGLARDNVIYGKLFKDNNKDLLNHIKIRNMALKRYRVTDSSIKSDLGLSVFDSNEPYDLIAISGEKETYDFFVGSTNNGTIREISLNVDDTLRFFTGIDKNIQKITYGLYQYIVEMELEDGTIDFLKAQAINLSNAYETLKIYNNEGTRKGNYDIVSDRFTQLFVENQENKYKNNLDLAPWKNSITTYLSVLDLLIDNLNVEKYSNSLLLFVHPRSGTPQGVSILLNLMESLLSKLASVVDVKNPNRTKGGNSEADSSIKTKNSFPAKTIKIQKTFNAIFDSDLPKNIGYDFLSSKSFYTNNNDDGLSVISKMDYEERVEKETNKYFKSGDVDINLMVNSQAITSNDTLVQNKYMYLTPSIVEMKSDERIDLLNKKTGLFEQKQYETFNARAMSFNFSKNSPRVPLKPLAASFSRLNSKEQTVKSDLSLIASSLGFNIKVVETKPKVEDFVVASKIIGSDSPFVKENSTTVEKVSDVGTRNNSEAVSSINPNSLLSAILMPEMVKGVKNKQLSANLNNSLANEKKDISIFNLASPKNIVGEISNINEANKRNSNVESIVKALPNQVKSLMVASVNPTAVNHNWFNQPSNVLKDVKKSLGFDMNYNIINEIEAFEGFEILKTRSMSRRLMKNEKWVKLTPEKFNESINKNIFCRMVKYNNKDFGIERPKGSELPTYNTYFIISPIEKIYDGANTKPNNVIREQIGESIFQTQKYLETYNNQYANSLFASAGNKVDFASLSPSRGIATETKAITTVNASSSFAKVPTKFKV